MPLLEKLQVMEAIWRDLSSRKDQIEVPAWHWHLLDSREELLKEGKATVIKWEQAKREIQKAIS
jgi:hypothetical protein